MIIDLILDRKDGEKYTPKDFYLQILDYSEVFPELANPISYAMNKGDEQNVKNALCDYVVKCSYNPNICDYINSVEWL